MEYKFFEHTADTIFEGYGKSYEEAFASAALAMQEVMTDTSRVEAKQEEKIEAEARDMKALLYDFLEKFLILKDAKNLVFSKFEVKRIDKTDRGYRLEAKAWGEEFNPEKHEDKSHVKAVTYHEMEIGEKEGKKYVRVLVDI
ncbi:MAG: archease [Candidatus Aenigmatarchaeota archaeon]